jgi:hypothetical protein
MSRQTSSFSVTIPLLVVTKILDKNPYRLLYSIQNLDAAIFIAIGSNPLVTAGVYGVNEGQHLAAGQPMSDDTDQAAVYARVDILGANAVNIAIVEISMVPEKENPGRRAAHLRPEEQRELRRETRTF